MRLSKLIRGFWAASWKLFHNRIEGALFALFGLMGSVSEKSVPGYIAPSETREEKSNRR
jgi:hypothetical protein